MTPDKAAMFLTLWRQCAPAFFDDPEPEHRFAPPRKWRFDWAWAGPEFLVAVEIDGGAWAQGRHTRGSGFERDLEKLNTATVRGWRVLRFTPQMLERDGAGCVALVVEALQAAREQYAALMEMP